MALAEWVAGALRPSQQISWTIRNPGGADDGAALDLSGATLTGKIALHGRGTPQAIAGTLSLIDAVNGVFRWDFDAADVATSGTHEVEFTATFGSGKSPAKTFLTAWKVNAAL